MGKKLFFKDLAKSALPYIVGMYGNNLLRHGSINYLIGASAMLNKHGIYQLPYIGSMYGSYLLRHGIFKYLFMFLLPYIWGIYGCINTAAQRWLNLDSYRFYQNLLQRDSYRAVMHVNTRI